MRVMANSVPVEKGMVYLEETSKFKGCQLSQSLWPFTKRYG